MLDDDVKEARARANALRQSLPQSVDAAALGVWSKAPFQLLCTREALKTIILLHGQNTQRRGHRVLNSGRVKPD
jgi:hypothetical protein